MVDAAVADTVPKMTIRGIRGRNNPRLICNLVRQYEFMEARFARGIRESLRFCKSVIGGGEDAQEASDEVRSFVGSKKYLKDRFAVPRQGAAGRFGDPPRTPKTKSPRRFGSPRRFRAIFLAAVTLEPRARGRHRPGAKDGSVVRNLTDSFDKTKA